MIFKLKCCGKENPIGVDPSCVRLHFETDGSREISTYTIHVREAYTEKSVCTLSEASFTAWVPADVLREKTEYRWQVQATLPDGTAVTSAPASFETGLQVWQGKWIGMDAKPGQVMEFSRAFTVDREIRKARLYICGLGYFQPKLNESRLDDAYFIPPVTEYATRPQFANGVSGHHVTYYTHDVTALLRAGENVLSAEVSDGYYSHWEKVNFEPLPDMSFGKPGLIYELHIEDAGGIRQIISDEETLVRPTNAIARLYDGDVVDYTREAAEYQPAVTIPAPDGVMTSPMCEDDRVYRVLKPVNSWKTPEGTVYDFGVNHSGGLRFTAKAKENTEICVRFAEVLREDGSLNPETGAWHAFHVETDEPQDIYQDNTYYLKQGENQIEPKFGWYCYRYALIPDTVEVSELCSLFISMDIPQNGDFRCSDGFLNRINSTFLQTLRCNMHSGILSDCPHRERLPYTGDGTVVMKSVCYNLSALDFYYKWFRDILDSQLDNGMIPNTATHLGGGGGYAWGNAVCTVTKELYALTGDMQVASRGYEAVKRWLEYYESKRDENYIIRSNSHSWLLGDWLAPEVVTSNVYYISTVCYLQAVRTARFLSGILSTGETAKWNSLERSIIDGINRVFFDEDRFLYGNGVQGENMLALAEGIVPERFRQQMLENVRYHYSVTTDYHLDTGIVLTPVLISFLTENGMQEIAWKIMTANTYPSYFTMMEGETTFCEHWSKKWPDYYIGDIGNSKLVKGGGDLSHCHPMFGSVAAWLYERVAGMDLTELYRNTVHIKPYFMEYLPWAKAEKQTGFGAISVDWSREKGSYKIALQIPAGLTAQCHFPASCKCLKNAQTNVLYYPDTRGYFTFSLSAGQWILTGEDEESQADARA